MYIFYDLETSDLNRNFSQIFQIGLIYADEDLNIIEEKEITCRRSPWLLPSPGALLTTGFTEEQLENNKNSHFDLINELVKWLEDKDWPLIFAGYNSLKFDEPFLQNCLHQNLREPFLTSSNRKWGEEKNSKIDILTMVKATVVFAPDLLTLEEKNSYGTPSISLGNVCRQNDIDLSEDAAHDAIADVRATLALAKKIKNEAPDIWEQMMTMRSKDKVDYFLNNNLVFGYSYAPTRGSYISDNMMATNIVENPSYSNEQVVFDLRFDPAEYIDKSVDELAEFMLREGEEHSDQPLRMLRKNQMPILMPFDMSSNLIGNELDEETLKIRAKLVKSNKDFQSRVAAAAKQIQTVYDKPVEPEQQIFEFVDKAFRKELGLWIEEFQQANWQHKQKLVNDFSNRFADAIKKQPAIKRFATFASRIIYENAPEVMTEDKHKKYATAILKRLTAKGDDVAWLTFDKVREQLDEIIEQRNNGDEKWENVTDKQIDDLRKYYNNIEEKLKSVSMRANNDNNMSSRQKNNKGKNIPPKP